MKKTLILITLLGSTVAAMAQTNPIITKWLRNTTGIHGRHYVSGNSTPINDADSANVKAVLYSATSVYIKTNGIRHIYPVLI